MRRVWRSLAFGVSALLTAAALFVAVGFAGLKLFDSRSRVVERNVARAEAHLDEISIGMSAAEVRHRLGSPSGHRGNCWVYGKGWVFSTPEVVEVCFEADRVTTRHRVSEYTDSD